jgi:hypothetical protein
MAGGWILSESKRMQELVNDDDLRPLGIPSKRQSESISAHENGRDPGLCERERTTPAASGSAAVIIPESIDAGSLGTGAPYHQRGH